LLGHPGCVLGLSICQVLSRTDHVTLRHVDLNFRKRNGKRDGFLAAAAEIYLSSLTDFHIVTRNSGFGVVAAEWARDWDNVYELDRNSSSTDDCGREGFKRIDRMEWFGI
jgi:hypothetical protein